MIDGNEVFISTTVLLEAEQVLHSVYQYATQQFSQALRAFAGLPNVTLEDAALDWLNGGTYFANALHLSKAGDHGEFVTFDRHSVRVAKKLGFAKVRRL